VGGDAALVETEQDRFGLDVVDRHADDMGDAPLRVADAVDPVDDGRRLEQAVGPTPGGGRFGLQHPGAG